MDKDKLERRFYRWQTLAYACVHCGKPRGRPWTLAVYGVCPLTRIKLDLTLRAETLGELRNALLTEPKVLEILTNELVRKALDNS